MRWNYGFFFFFRCDVRLLDMEKSDAGAAVGLPRRRGYGLGLGETYLRASLTASLGTMSSLKT